MRFVYLGPPDEPGVMETFHALTGEWVKGQPRDIEDASAIERLARHPHWAAVEGEADAGGGDEPAPVKRGPGRPRRVV